MRIEQEIKKIGYFWLHDNEDKKIPGILTVTDGGDVTLEIFGLFDDSIEAMQGQEVRLPRIVGIIEKEGYVTLKGNMYLSQTFVLAGAPTTNKIVSQYAFFGVIYEKNEDILFDSLRFSLEGLDEWLHTSGISSTYYPDFGVHEAKCIPKNDIVYHLEENYELRFCFYYGITKALAEKEVSLRQTVNIKLISPDKKPIQDFISLSRKIVNFFSFAMDETISIKNVIVSSDELSETCNEKEIPISIKAFYHSRPFSKDIPDIKISKMLFRYLDIRDSFENKINRWLSVYKSIEPSLNLYFAVKNGPKTYLESKFLSLAQALETYHRSVSDKKFMDEETFQELKNKIINGCPYEHKDWLKMRLEYANEISLRNRIKEIIEPFKEFVGSSAKRKKLIGQIVDTRNYLTHYNEDLKGRAVCCNGLSSLNDKMEGLLELAILQEIGFIEEEIKIIFDGFSGLKNKLADY